jgi:hypothetical protein
MEKNNMMRTMLLTCGFILIFFFGQAIYAIRIAPEEVPAIERNGIRYTVTHSQMGCVEAWDIKTGLKLWDKEVYQVKIDPFMEECTQWIYITSLKIENDRLVVANEMKGTYTLDPRTGDRIESIGPLVYSLGQDRTVVVLPYLTFGLVSLSMAAWLFIRRRKTFTLTVAIMAVLFTIWTTALVIWYFINNYFWSPGLHYYAATVAISLLIILICTLVIFNIRLAKYLMILTAIVSILMILAAGKLFISRLLDFISRPDNHFYFSITCLGFAALMATMLTYIIRVIKKLGVPAEEIEQAKDNK